MRKRKENGGNGLPWGLPFFPSKLEGNKKEERVVHGVGSISFPSFYLVKQTKENYSPFPFLSLPNIDNNFNLEGYSLTFEPYNESSPFDVELSCALTSVWNYQNSMKKMTWDFVDWFWREREREREKFKIEDVNCVKDLKKKNTRIIHNILK